MSHYINTQHAPKRSVGTLSGRQLLEIITGVAVVIALVVAAYAYVNTADPIASSGTAVRPAPLAMVAHDALSPFEAQHVSPRLQSAIGATASPAPLTMVAHSALDPFETQFAAPHGDLDIGAGTAPLTMVTHNAPDPFEAQHASPQLRAAIGAGTAPLTTVTHSALDPFETQFAAPQGDPDIGASSELAEDGSPNPMPEFR